MIRLVTPELTRPNTIEELSKMVSSHQNEDIIASIGEITLANDKISVRGKSYAVRPSGFKGLLSYIKMPLGYASSIPNDLLYDSVNRLTTKTYADSEVLLRLQDSELRAVLSPNYVPLDSSELMKHISKASKLGLKPARISYDGDNITAAFITEVEVKAVEVGDISNIGITIETSDIGDYPLSSGAYLMRLVCQNGTVLPARMGGGLSFNQKGSNPETVWNSFGGGLEKILNRMSQIDSNFLIRLQNKKVDASNFIRVKNKLSEFVSGRKISHVLLDMENDVLEKGVSLSLYDLYNKVTNVATTEPNLLTARSLEIAAGELLFEYGVSVN